MKTGDTHASPAELITAAIIERLEQGVRPWVRPWRSGAAGSRPLRANGTPYRGMNTFWLWLAADAAGFGSNFWMTYKQAQALGGQVRSGERSQIAIFYKSYTKRGEAAAVSGESADEQRRVMRAYAVFNADQVDGLPADFHPPVASLVPPSDSLTKRAEAFVAQLPAHVRHGGSEAYYDRAADIIAMPQLALFGARARWAATLAHEAGHNAATRIMPHGVEKALLSA